MRKYMAIVTLVVMFILSSAWCVKYHIYIVKGASMANTLYDEDIVIVEKNIQIKHNDIVVFRHPRQNNMCIKRCIGVAGDTITIDKNHIYINDTLKYVYNDDVANKRKIIVPQENDSLYIDSLNYDIYKFAIKFVENNNFQLNTNVVFRHDYYFIGDNVDYSVDSRDYGIVPQACIMGKVTNVLFSKKMLRKGIGFKNFSKDVL